LLIIKLELPLPSLTAICVITYIDRNDQLAKYYSFARKVMKIWKKQFFYLLNSMVLQAYTAYLININ